MKRGGTRPFRTLGTRMREFGRSLMRHYVPPGDTPLLVEPPAPAWGAASETPLIWPEAGAPPGFTDETALDAGYTEGAETADTGAPAQPRRAPRKPAPQPPPSQAAPVQRKPAPQQTSHEQRLLNILTMHQEREAERQRFRDEKKSAFDAAEIQRQADPDAPQRPRRGRMSVDYIETSALSRGEETPVKQPPPPQAESPVLDEGGRDEGDTVPLDTRAIQAKLAEDGIDWQPAPQPVEDFDAPNDVSDSADQYGDDDSEDDDGGGASPRIDTLPPPLPPSGVAQRAPQPGADDTFDSFDAGYDDGGAGDEPRPLDVMDYVDTPAPSTANRAGRVYQPLAPDFPDESDRFEPAYDAGDESVEMDALPTQQVNTDAPSTRIQRTPTPPSAPDMRGDVVNDYAQPDDDEAGDVSDFMDDGDTRPTPVQRAPILTPPDFADDSAPSDETGYSSLSNWVDAHAAAPTPLAPPRAVQRSQETAAPDVSGEFVDFDQPDDDAAGDVSDFREAPQLDADDGDTRPMPLQRAPILLPPDFTDEDTGFEPSYDAGEAIDNGDTPDAAGMFRVVGDLTADDFQYEMEEGDFLPPIGNEVADDGFSLPAYDDGDDAPEQPTHWNADVDVGTQQVMPSAGAAPVQRAYEQLAVDADFADKTAENDFLPTAYDDGNDFSAPSPDWNADVDVGTQQVVPSADTAPIQRAYEQTTAFSDEVEYGGFAVQAYDDSGDVGVQQAAPPAEAAPVQRAYQQPTVDADTAATPDSSYFDDTYQTDDSGYDAPIVRVEDGYESRYTGPPEWSVDASTADVSSAVQRAEDTSTPDADVPMSGFPGDDVYETDITALLDDQVEQIAPRRGQRRPAPQPEYDAQDETASFPDDGDMAEAPLDLYEAMMGAGIVESSPATNFYNPPAVASPDAVQRAPQPDMPQQPIDLYEAMMGAGLAETSPIDDFYDDQLEADVSPSAPDAPMSPATKADLLNLLDTTPRPEVSQRSGSAEAVSRVYQPPDAPHQPAPPSPSIVQRAAEPAETSGEDVDVDQLARDVYSKLRNRLRVERERRDRKS